MNAITRWWRLAQGVLRDLRGIRAGFTKVRFFVEQDESGWPPISFEGIWTVKVGPNRYRVDNVPWFVQNVAVGDIVTANEIENDLIADEVVERGGHSTIWVIVRADDDRTPVSQELIQVGCRSEVMMEPIRNFITVDIPPDIDGHAVIGTIIAAEAAERLDYEIAHLAFASQDDSRRSDSTPSQEMGGLSSSNGDGP